MPELPMIANAGTIEPAGRVSAPDSSAIEGISRSAERLEWMAHYAIREENEAKVQGATGDLIMAEAGIKADLATVHDADEYQTRYKDSLNQVQSKILEGFGPGSLRNQVADVLGRHNSQFQAQATAYATHLKIGNANDAQELATTKLSHAAVFGSTPEARKVAEDGMYAAVDANNFTTDSEKAEKKQQLGATITHMRGVDIALRHPDQLADFIKENNIPAADAIKLQDTMVAGQNQAKQMREARNGIAIDGAIGQVDALMRANRMGEAEALANYYHAHDLIPDHDYRSRFGHPAPEEDVPGLYEDKLKQIAADPQAFTDSIIRATPGLSRLSASKAVDYWQKLKLAAKTPAGIAKAEAINRLKDHIYGGTGNPMIDGMLNAKLRSDEPSFNQTLNDRAMRMLEARMGEGITPGQIPAIEEEINKFIGEKRKEKLEQLKALSPDMGKTLKQATGGKSIDEIVIPLDKVRRAAAAARAENWKP